MSPGVLQSDTLQVAKADPIDSYTSALNAGGAEVLFTTEISIDGAEPVATPIATGAKQRGSAESSTVVLVTFPLENVVDLGSNTKAAVFTRLMEY